MIISFLMGGCDKMQRNYAQLPPSYSQTITQVLQNAGMLAEHEVYDLQTYLNELEVL